MRAEASPKLLVQLPTEAFTILYVIKTIGQSVLEDLRRRLAATRWPDSPEDAGWSLGTDLAFMRRLTDH